MTDQLEEKAGLCALGQIFGFEPKIPLALISHYGSAAQVFNAPAEEIDTLLGPYSKFKGKIRPSAVDAAAAMLEMLKSEGINFTGWTESGYPEALKECEDAPVGLYIRSTTPAEHLFNGREAVAVVGTRDCSPYGEEWCKKIVSSLALTKEKPLIVSGLAYGIDICAHKAALDNGLGTVAVMATGADRVYPSRHTAFAEKISNTTGSALITDYPPGTPPLAVHFLRRNRIIAGLCGTTVLIESKSKGGGIMTANLAFSYNRNVFALPGRSDDIRSQGCNILIRNNIAEPIIDGDDFISRCGFGKSHQKDGQEISASERVVQKYGRELPHSKVCAMTDIILAIRNNRGITIEELCSRTGMDYSEVAKNVSILETDGIVSTDLLQRCSINMKNI